MDSVEDKTAHRAPTELLAQRETIKALLKTTSLLCKEIDDIAKRLAHLEERANIKHDQ